LSASLIDRRQSRGSYARDPIDRNYIESINNLKHNIIRRNCLYYIIEYVIYIYIPRDRRCTASQTLFRFGSLMLYTRKYFKRSRLIDGGLLCDFRVHVCAINNDNYYDIRSAGSAWASSVYSALLLYSNTRHAIFRIVKKLTKIYYTIQINETERM